MNDDVFGGVGVEVEFDRDEDFLKIRETLTRIGIASRKENRLYQSCHILHKKGHYAILHFKELFLLDGKGDVTVIDDDDYGRRNAIVKLLEEWKLLRIVSDKDVDSPSAPLNTIKVISFREKARWDLVAKYQVGTHRKKAENP
jgi:hypothetical protein